MEPELNMRGNFKTILLALALLFSVSAIAQPGGGRRPGARMERVHAMKTAFITERLQLGNAQAERFWPLYNKYEGELFEVRVEFLKNKRQQARKQDMSEEEARQQIEDNLEMQEAVINLRKKYKDEFLKVISPNQLVDLYEAEKEFRQRLMKELRDRRANGVRMRRGVR